MFMLPVPSWVHPAWMIGAGLLSLVVARKMVKLRWTATIVVAAYLLYRAVMWLVLVGMNFPPSVLPLVLLAGAVLVDLFVTYRVPGWLAGLLTTGIVYAVGFAQESLELLPPWNWWSAVPVAVGFALLWTAVDLLERSAWLDRWRTAVEPAPEDKATASV
jgi:hypothetical protein